MTTRRDSVSSLRTTDPVRVATTSGPVVGAVDSNGIVSFRGVPYAAAPVGPRRFQPPQPPQPWSDLRSAVAYGPTAPQDIPDTPVAALLPHVVEPGDDYLNLNVWTPAVDGSRPVMVFVHGGAFVHGSGSIPVYDGARFAGDGIVLVTVNYRLGADGFVWFGDGVPNLGLLDQVAALRWVRDNIGAFGGDPANVTVFGESAGAMSLCTLLAMPAAGGLFRRVIAQSGAARCVIGSEAASVVGRRLAQVLGVEPTREAIGRAPMPLLLQAQHQVAREVAENPDPSVWHEVGANLMPFEPVVDGTVLPRHPTDAIRDGAGAGVDLLVGTNSDEAHLFFVPTGVAAAADDATLRRYAAVRHYPQRVVDTYRATRPDTSSGELLSALMTDGYYRLPALELAADHAGTFVYEFAWRSPAYGGAIGSCHTLELPFVFDRLDDPGYASLLGPDAPQSAADAVHRAWVDFATTGDPGWRAWATATPYSMRFDTDSAVTCEARAAELGAWRMDTP